MTTATDRYHHGDLPNALRRAAAEVIEERGLGGFSLREVARRAGVSHNAPAHHFGDTRGLLTSLATEGFDLLYTAAVEGGQVDDDPVDRLTTIGIAYVELAGTHPAQCDVMFRVDLIDPDDAALIAAGERAYSLLEDTVRSIIESEGLEADLDGVVWLCWSAMQGLVVLQPKIARLNEERGGREFTTEDLVRRFTGVIVGGIRAGSPC